MQDKLDKFAEEIRSLEGRNSTEDKYLAAIDLTLGPLDDLGMVPTASSLRRMENKHLEELDGVIAGKDEEIADLEHELSAQ